jgi:CBS domain-containing protein
MLVGVATCPPETPLPEVARLMLEKDLEAVIILDQEEGHALGVVSQDELVQAYIREEARTLKAVDVMREEVPQIPPDIPLAAAVQMMLDQQIRTFFLMHHAGGIVYPAASISYRHILRHLAAREEEDLSGLGIEAARQSPVEMFIQKRDAARRRIHSQR